MLKVGLSVCILVVGLTGCFQSFAFEPEEMETLSVHVKALARAAENETMYGNGLPNLVPDTDRAPLVLIDDPELLSKFDGYVVRMTQNSNHAVVLVCTPDGDQALIEDADCTPALDERHWEANPPKSCDFTFNTLFCPQ